MKSKVRVMLFVLIALCLLLPSMSFAETSFPVSKDKNGVYDSFELSKVDKDKAAVLEKRYLKDSKKLPKVKNFNSSELKKLRKIIINSHL